MIRQLGRFASVGALATLIHVTVALILDGIAGLAPQAANLGGFLAAVSFSYVGHLHFTFGVAPRHAQHGPRFLAVALAAYAASAAMTYAINTALGLPFAVAMLVVAGVVPATTFLALRLWTFAERRPER
ncbi:MAG: GtrA family protein [Silicimonas sp.]|nr:GtrA family protein [Silicimonas sp.]